MKQIKFWIAGLVFALLAAASANINLKYGAADGKELILTNAEILAQGEGGDNDCSGSGSLTCGGGQYKEIYNG